MKKITLSMSLFLLCLLGFNSNADAQNRRSSFRVDAPASIQGYKIIDEIDSTSTTAPWGTSIDSTWEGMDVIYDPNNLDGCVSFAPGYFTGKFALIFRGGCEFGSKAKRAQDAGARGVIIVNNLLGVVGMGAGADGALVEIPVVMVTNADGNAMKAQIDASNPVTISLAAWNFDPIANPIDIGFMNDGPALPLGRSIPSHQVSTQYGMMDEDFRVFGGSVFYNFSTNSWDTLFQKVWKSYNASLSGGSFTLEDSNSVNWSFATPVNTLDSILAVRLDTVGTTLQGFDMNDAPKGRYLIENTMATIPFTETGLAPLNNDWAYEFAIHDSVYSKCEYDFVKGRPVANSYINVNSAAEWGPILHIRNGGFSAKKVQVVLMRPTIDDSVFTGQDVLVTLSKWSDNDANGAIDYASELDEIANATYQLTATDVFPIGGLLLTMNLVNTVAPGQLIKLEDMSNYWLRVSIPGTTTGFAIGADYYSDYRANLQFDNGYGNPLYFNGTMYGGGFANAGSPSIALHMNTNKTESVEDIANFAGSVNVYPNPTSSVVNVAVELDQMSASIQYEIMDVTGKVLDTHSVKNAQQNTFTYNTSKLSAGTYFVNVITENGRTQSKFVVTK